MWSVDRADRFSDRRFLSVLGHEETEEQTFVERRQCVDDQSADSSVGDRRGIREEKRSADLRCSSTSGQTPTTGADGKNASFVVFRRFSPLQIERSKNKGENWFHMPAPEMTEEKKNDLMAIQMRGGLFADKFFKKGSDVKGLPKYFQVDFRFPSLLTFPTFSRSCRPALWSIIQQIFTVDCRRKIARRPFSKNFITTAA